MSQGLIIFAHFLRRGYPFELVLENWEKVQAISREEALIPKEAEMTDEEEKIFYLISTYNPNNNQIRDIVLQKWDILRRSSATKDLAENKIVFGFRKNPNLKDILVRSRLPKIKDPSKMAPKSNVA